MVSGLSFSLESPPSSDEYVSMEEGYSFFAKRVSFPNHCENSDASSPDLNSRDIVKRDI